MVKVKQDLTGMTFGRLTVLKQVDDYKHPNGTNRARWLCECSCPEHNQVIVNGDQLKNKNGTRSCGCLQKESLDFVHTNNKKYNLYNLSGEYGIGWTSNTNKEFYFDLEDYNKIKDYCWREEVDHSGYHFLATTISGKHTIMSWIIIGKYYDHQNRNALDNRKQNLRPSSYSENARNRSVPSNNTSGIIGVHWDKRKCMWVVQIGFKGTRIRIGEYVNKTDAIINRLTAELKYFGPDFAPQRHLFKEYEIVLTDKENNNELQ
jgi:hypothetical protein